MAFLVCPASTSENYFAIGRSLILKNLLQQRFDTQLILWYILFAIGADKKRFKPAN
jgi:hypothetical protein